MHIRRYVDYAARVDMGTVLASWLVVGSGLRLHVLVRKGIIANEKLFKAVCGQENVCLPMPLREEYHCPTKITLVINVALNWCQLKAIYGHQWCVLLFCLTYIIAGYSLVLV